MRKASAIFSIVIGVCIVGMWVMLLATGQVVELANEPYRIISHIASEFMMAGLLIISALGTFSGKHWATVLQPVAFGALLYSVLTAGGYYLQRLDIAMVTMFGVLLFATGFFIVGLLVQLRVKKV